MNTFAGVNLAESVPISVQGMLSLALTAWVPGLTPGPAEGRASWIQNTLLYTSLYIVALGTGGIKPNVSAFGADQFDDSIEQVSICISQSSLC